MRGFQYAVRGNLQLIISFPDPNSHAHAHRKEGVSHAEIKLEITWYLQFTVEMVD